MEGADAPAFTEVGGNVMNPEEPLTDAELAEIQTRCVRAAPGPWRSMIEGRDHTSGSSFIMTGPAGARGRDMELSGATDDDQDFIAHARDDVPRLVAEVRRLRALLGSPANGYGAPEVK